MHLNEVVKDLTYKVLRFVQSKRKPTNRSRARVAVAGKNFPVRRNLEQIPTLEEAGHLLWLVGVKGKFKKNKETEIKMEIEIEVEIDSETEAVSDICV